MGSDGFIRGILNAPVRYSIVEEGKMKVLWKAMKYLGGLVCTFGGVYLGNAYGAGYWRFGPFNLAWDTLFRGSLLVIIGFLLIRFGK